jgi:amino acid permease
MTRNTAKEDTSLLPPPESLTEESSQGHATFSATVVNLMKTCMGTGTLALPFACQQGGLLLHTVGLVFIAGWNFYSVHRLCQALVYLKSNSNRTASPPHGTSTFGKVAWFAFGERGVHGLDMGLVILFFGILVAYEGEPVATLDYSEYLLFVS